MTWYASHIYTNPTEEVRSIFASHRVLSRGMYWIKDLQGFDWPQFMSPHEWPANGLFVVREVCDPTLGKDETDTNVEAQYHVGRGYRVLSWKSVIGTEMLPIILPPALPTYAFGTLHFDKAENFPPQGFLSYLKNLAQITNSTVIYYHRESGAEMAVFQEYAWVFGEDELVYVKHGWDTIMKYTEGHAQTLSTRETVLMLILKYFGLHLNDWNFAPHTMKFNWHKYDVSIK